MKCQVPVYFQIYGFLTFCQNEINAGDFASLCHCWRSAGGNTEMLEPQLNLGDLATMAHCSL